MDRRSYAVDQGLHGAATHRRRRRSHARVLHLDDSLAMTDWIRLFVLAGLVLVSCGGQIGDTAEAGGVGAGGGSAGSAGALQGGGGQGNAGAGFAGTSGMAGAAGSTAGASGSKDGTNACVLFPAADPPSPSTDPLITFVFHSLFVGDVDWSGQGDGNAL